MRLLDRYIIKSVIGLFLGCLFIFLFLYIIIDTFAHLEDILRQHVSLVILKQYYLSFLPMIFVQVAPIACLLAVLYTFSKLNHDNEIIAMRSAGLSIFQITRPVFIFGAIISVLVFWVNDRFVPTSQATTLRIKEQMDAGTKKSTAKEHEIINNLCIYGMKNRLFHINKFNASANTMEGITILEHDNKQNLIKKIVANKGVYENNLWRFSRSITYDFDEQSQIKNEPQYFEEEIMAIPESPKDFISQRQRPELMTIAQLDDYIWKLTKSGAAATAGVLKVDYYNRFGSALTSLIIILLGIPFSLKMKKRATGLSSVGISIMLGFLYYVLNAITLAIGKSGVLIPILAASSSHIIALATGIYLLKRLP